VARATPRPVRGAYLIHTGYELPLLLEGRKKLAVFSDAYPPDEHWNERYFTPYVEKGVIHREIDIEPFDPPSVRKDGTRFDGMRTVYYTPKGEEWRIPAYKLVWQAALKSRWNEHFERIQGMFFGYEDWQMEWWMKDGALFTAVPRARDSPIGSTGEPAATTAGSRSWPPRRWEWDCR
jgi:hypothetical protein